MTEEKAVAKVPLNIDLTKGIVPKDYNEALQMAALLHASDLAPKSLDNVQKIAVAIFMCLELGRPIMTGIQDIAVINGKAGIYGDAALAIVRGSGFLEDIHETESGTPFTDGWTFRCEIKRKGAKRPVIGVWSWADSIRAGFDKADKHLPWTRFTRRMMQFKARNFPLRDEFGDVLKGMRLSEDNMDAIDMYPDEASGAYEKPEKVAVTEITEERQTTDIDFFAEFIRKTVFLPHMVDLFLEKTAEANDLSVEEVKKEALEDKEAFSKAAGVWIATQQDEGVSGGDDKAEEVTLFDELKSMRPKTSEKNTAAFRALILENIAEIREWPEKDQDYLRSKWNNTFPDESFNGRVGPPGTEWADDILRVRQEEEEGRDPDPPSAGAGVPDEGSDDKAAHVPPWEDRKRFLDAMKDLHDQGRDLYFKLLGEQGYEKANDVPRETDQEDATLNAIRTGMKEN